MQQFNKLMHKAVLGAIFRRPELFGINRPALAPVLEQIEPFINFQLPGAPVHPFAQLATAAQC